MLKSHSSMGLCPPELIVSVWLRKFMSKKNIRSVYDSAILNKKSQISDDKITTVVIFALIVASLLTESILLPASVAYIFVVIFYIFLGIVALRFDLSIRMPYWAFMLLFSIWILYLLHLISPIFIERSMSIGVIIRPPVYIIFGLVNLFIIPYLLSPKRFFSFLGALSTVLVLIGLPMRYINIQVLWIDFSTWGTMDLLGQNVFRITSIFWNPNVAGFLFMIGVVVSVVIYVNSKSTLWLAQSVINATGVLLTNSRAVYLGVTAGISFFVFFYFTNAHLTKLAVVCYSIASSIGVLVFANVLPRPASIGPADFGERPGLWEGAVEAITNAPFGYGTQPSSQVMEPYLSVVSGGVHNSYLRVFLTTGIIGGISYILFIIFSILSTIQKKATVENYLVFVTVIAIATREIFSANTVFGISMTSILSSIAFGYAIQMSSR